MAEVVLKKVEKEYPNGFKAVHGIDLKVNDGEFMVLVGPSGCSKSTTLRMVAGLEDITGGEIWIGDRCVNEVQPKDRKIAMVFQNYVLYSHMTAYENMSFGLKFQIVPKKEIKEQVMDTAVKLEITDYWIESQHKSLVDRDKGLRLVELLLEIQKYSYLTNLFQILMQN